MGTYVVDMTKAELTNLAEVTGGMRLSLRFGAQEPGKKPSTDLRGTLKVNTVVVHPPGHGGKVVELTGTLEVGFVSETARLRYYPEYKSVIMRTDTGR